MVKAQIRCITLAIIFKFSISYNCSIGYQGALCDECGIVYANNNLKIIGGVTAIANSWPSIAYLKFTYKGTYSLPDGTLKTLVFRGFCGGTLIDRQTILTAAHCIQTSVEFQHEGVTYSGLVITNSDYPTYPSMYKVYLGVHDKTLIDDFDNVFEPMVKLSVSKIVVHRDYDAKTFINDIALIFLSKNVTLNKYIQLGCLPLYQSTTYPGVNVTVYAAGWGLKSSEGEPSSTLNNVKLTAYNESYCSKVQVLYNGQLCAGNIKGGQDTCQGDSGGPLYFLDSINSKNKYVVAGITSFGKDCALVGYPGIYTRVSNYLDWIEAQTSLSIIIQINSIKLFYSIIISFSMHRILFS